jgi:hypothetical protein
MLFHLAQEDTAEIARLQDVSMEEIYRYYYLKLVTKLNSLL